MPRLNEHPIHLGPQGAASIEPPMTGPEWFDGYGARHEADGAEGRLVTEFSFSESWDMWEAHPAGAEIVICISGGCTLLQEQADGRVERVPLTAGSYAVNPAGVWHTAELAPGERATCIFITPGEGTEHRPR